MTMQNISPSKMERAHNFNPGPSALPLSVLTLAQTEFLNYQSCGMSILEMSHRSSAFEKILNDAILDLTHLLKLPSHYGVCFMAGGATAQFAAVAMNFNRDMESEADYLVTGCWSQSAFKEAKKYLKTNLVASSESTNFDRIPARNVWKISPNSNYFHYCHNETVHGTEFRAAPNVCTPIIADMSSCFLSGPIDIEKYAVIYAGAQKNVGPAGVTIVIINKEILKQYKPHPSTPIMLDYNIQLSKNSMYNTPPVFNIYLTALVFKWIKEQSLEKLRESNDRKSLKIYETIDNSNGFYIGTVKDIEHRSRMNVNFTLSDLSLLPMFLKECKERNMVGLAGHRSVGGCRASIYNAVSEESVDVLCAFMKEFQRKHQKS